MNKQMLGAFALAIGMTFFPSGSSADIKLTPPQLQISGYGTTSFHWFDNSPAARGEYGYGTYFAVEDSRLNFQATGRMDIWDATFYDWLVGISGDTSETNSIEENRIRLKSKYGTVLFGVYRGVEDMMARGAFGVMGGTGGFDGNFKATTSQPLGIFWGTNMVGATKGATKITYLTPRFVYKGYGGIQFGITFTPNSEQKGQKSPNNASSTKSPQEPFDLSSKAFGINYLNEFENGFSAAASATAIFAHTKTPAGGAFNASSLWNANQTGKRHDTASYALGFVLGYQGFELGGEWIDNGKSRELKNPIQVYRATGYAGELGKFNAGHAWSMAGGYTFGANKVAYGYYHSGRKFNGGNVTTDIHSVTLDRAVVPGFSLFAEGVWFDLDTSQKAVELSNAMAAQAPGDTFKGETVDNSGRTLLMGAKFKF